MFLVNYRLHRYHFVHVFTCLNFRAEIFRQNKVVYTDFRFLSPRQLATTLYPKISDKSFVLPIKMADSILENHKIVTMEHEMRIDGHYLSEKKQKTHVDPKDAGVTGATTIYVHVRTIDKRCCKVTEIEKPGQDNPERNIETEMSEEEMEQFEQDWNELWNPRITDKQIASLQ